LLENITLKKLVLLIASEGKKWSLHIRKGDYGGKMWETMVVKSGGICVEGIIPHPTNP
jgi:hypothetical protein